MPAPHPKRIRLSRARGWRMPAGAIRVARPGRWGNPYVVGTPGIPDARTAVRLFRALLEARGAEMAEDLRALRGHDLACWCALDAPCHADVLLEFANR